MKHLFVLLKKQLNESPHIKKNSIQALQEIINFTFTLERKNKSETLFFFARKQKRILIKIMSAKIANFNRIKIEIQHLKHIHDLRLKIEIIISCFSKDKRIRKAIS